MAEGFMSIVFVIIHTDLLLIYKQIVGKEYKIQVKM